MKNFRFSFSLQTGLLLLMALGLASCAEISPDLKLSDTPEPQLRSGPMGTLEEPFLLDPFKKYDLVMAGDECRYFVVKVPNNWYWKVYLTAVNRSSKRQGVLKAEIVQGKRQWEALPEIPFGKIFELDRESVQGLIGVGNKGLPRFAMLRFCQEGAPLRVTLESQMSAAGELMPPESLEHQALPSN